MEELIAKMRVELEKIPGVAYNFSQPIAHRVDHLVSGVKSQVAVKIFGEDLHVLRDKAEAAVALLQTIPGITDLRAEQVAGLPNLNIKIDRARISRYGLNVADVQEVIETAVGGKAATEIIEGQTRVEVLVRFPAERRNSPEAIGNILVATPGGGSVPLAALTEIRETEGPLQISRDDARRRIVVEFNIKDRDTGSVVADGQKLLSSRLSLPPGYYISWGGTFENQERAMQRLLLIVPVTLALIYLLLFLTFGSLRYATLIMMNLPLALAGGILGLLITGQYLSVPAAVGFIALFGVAVLNGVVLVSQINQLRQEGLPLDDAVRQGCDTAAAAGADDCPGGNSSGLFLCCSPAGPAPRCSGPWRWWWFLVCLLQPCSPLSCCRCSTSFSPSLCRYLMVRVQRKSTLNDIINPRRRFLYEENVNELFKAVKRVYPLLLPGRLCRFHQGNRLFAGVWSSRRARPGISIIPISSRPGKSYMCGWGDKRSHRSSPGGNFCTGSRTGTGRGNSNSRSRSAARSLWTA